MSDQNDPDQAMPLAATLNGMDSKAVVIGDMARWKAQGRDIPPLDGFQFIDIADLDAIFKDGSQPDIILSPLVADGFDAVDVAIKLIKLQFRGRYRVIANDMPDAALIRQEVRSFAPQLDFDLLLMPTGGKT
ncbi:hypothetical protein [Yoonia sp. 2307UL14-13]|uniref:hypothetical protein n=1 Tax=Yoonia sp. 2307UL14-13 TaxID=3126506 RepID=UPI0030A4F23A